MATIRVRDWTKDRIEEIREAESHSSHDSVIKSLLKDRQLAQFAGTPASDADEEPTPDDADDEPAPSPDGAFDDLTVLGELPAADNGVVFLWCPNCPNEVAHVGFDGPASISAMEVNCQRCLTRLDEHAIVEIDVGYPLEERVVAGTLHDDLRTCVIDYWDRALARAGEGDGEADGDGGSADVASTAGTPAELLRTIDGHLREFGWDWPADVPAVTLRPGRRYRDAATGDRFEVLSTAAGDGGDDPVEGRRIRLFHAPTADGDATAAHRDRDGDWSWDPADGEETTLDGATVADRLLDRRLFVVGRAGDAAGPTGRDGSGDGADADGSGAERRSGDGGGPDPGGDVAGATDESGSSGSGPG
jgi:hypothetical protein